MLQMQVFRMLKRLCMITGTSWNLGIFTQTTIEMMSELFACTTDTLQPLRFNAGLWFCCQNSPALVLDRRWDLHALCYSRVSAAGADSESTHSERYTLWHKSLGMRLSPSLWGASNGLFFISAWHFFCEVKGYWHACRKERWRAADLRYP